MAPNEMEEFKRALSDNETLEHRITLTLGTPIAKFPPLAPEQWFAVYPSGNGNVRFDVTKRKPIVSGGGG